MKSLLCLDVGRVIGKA